MAISTKFAKPAEATFFAASLGVMGADTRHGITPAVRASLDQMNDIAAGGKVGSVIRLAGYEARLAEASGPAAPTVRAGAKPGTGF